MVYLYQMKKNWMPSINVTADKKVSNQRVISVQSRKNENSAQNDKYLDDDKLRDIIQMVNDLKGDLRALAEKVGKIDSNHDSLKN